jgi:hypothetical protein
MIGSQTEMSNQITSAHRSRGAVGLHLAPLFSKTIKPSVLAHNVKKNSHNHKADSTANDCDDSQHY